MLIYNITIKVQWSIAADWMTWMKTIHIPEVLNTGCFINHQLLRLLQIDETEGPTYALQYFASTLTEYDYYHQHYAFQFSKKITEKWGDRYIDFRTLMEVVDLN